MFSNIFKNLREKSPLVHCITNYVTVNDCANILIACNGSSIMSDDSLEVEEITSICGGLNINIGTLNKNTIESMFLAGKKSNELNHPVILDPVGAGASKLRTDTAKELLDKIKFTVIRGNISEIKTLALGFGTTKGVDADIADAITEESLEEIINFTKDFSKKTGAIIAITGSIDIVCNDNKVYIIRNGHPMMSKITGSGCMLTAMTGAYLVANPENYLEATAASLCAMGIAGELAYKKLEETGAGNSSYRNYLIDEIYNLTAEKLDGGAKFEVR
ncbi:hydroxyethylthiazole kinase [Clostridium sp.]|uniref:hydroxyethylthiazole kinase n=1 Tax=Clostridium sp. TaxID=1506 RepID=UPI002619FCAF|nr:hydroxyethylthiazole kinase [Clostridium sp.]